MSSVPAALRKRLLTLATALTLGVAGVAMVPPGAPQPSPAVQLAMEIGAHYESSGRHIGTPYRDMIGKGQPWTVCHGVTGPGVVPGRYYTPEDCRKLELPIYQRAENAARAMFRYWDSYNIWVQASVIDMIYNLGAESVQSSTLLRLGNGGDLVGMCQQMPRWVRGTVNGKKVVMPGLVDRRGTTRELCAEWGRDGHFSVAGQETQKSPVDIPVAIPSEPMPDPAPPVVEPVIEVAPAVEVVPPIPEPEIEPSWWRRLIDCLAFWRR